MCTAGELVRVLSKCPTYSDYLRKHVFEPLGMRDTHVGMGEVPSSAHRSTPNTRSHSVLSRDGDRLTVRRSFSRAVQLTYASYLKANRLCELRTYQRLRDGTFKHRKVPDGASRDEAMACVPGANGRAPASEMIKAYEMLLLGGIGANGCRLLTPETVAKYTSRARVGMEDEVTKDATDWSQATAHTVPSGPHTAFSALRPVMRARGTLRTAGRSAASSARAPSVAVQRAPRRATAAHTVPALSTACVHSSHCGACTMWCRYGHGGSQSSIAWVDPVRGFTAIVFLNGRPGPDEHRMRLEALCRCLYDDLAALCQWCAAAASQQRVQLLPIAPCNHRSHCALAMDRALECAGVTTMLLLPRATRPHA
jgi:CubicO group peptidase (beta-lactamase class C family)